MRILVIEDDPVIQGYIKKGCRYKHCTVDQAFDGEEGLEKIARHSYALAIVDLLLPKMDGASLIQKAREKGSHTPILVLSAVQELTTKTHLLETGVDDYMTKPFSFEELYARIQAITRRNQNTPPTNRLVIADLILDPERHSLICGKREITLRGKEFELMEYFMRRPDRVISREELLQNVWSPKKNSQSNTVDVHIASLRKKISSLTTKAHIKTLHGIGYIFGLRL